MKPFLRSTFYLGLVVGVGQIALAADSAPVPNFQVDSSWPGRMPNKWAIGQVSGLAVTANDHILVIHRPRSLKDDQKMAAANPAGAECCVPAPAVIEFAPNGKVVRAWGGPGSGYDWPQSEHGIYADGKGNVWVSGVAGKDFGRILKFTSDGKFLMQIGENLPAGQTFDNNSMTVLGRQPADMYVDLKANELFVADGDGGASRLIVFDSETGKFKRMWGAYGDKPGELPAPKKHDPNGPPPKVFSSAVHCVVAAKDGSLYVCDRDGDRVQIFKKDGTFLKEKFVAPKAMGAGAAFDIDFSPDHRYLYWVDGRNQVVRILQADSLEEIGSFGSVGPEAGQFRNVHSIAVDSKNNVYIGEAGEGKRVQKFVPKSR
jgi:DNA-binding beta-propeller fold protein YncE